ncbi:uncharacterized protein LOC123194574 isoform X1 [Mangifera indica]|uniref:uncharacterized protein LOC123194574 isoform X1 n=1 Tax=Mangifera indica TaxID=29780 RepID=UPI001CFA66DE|nr:uncharacterized protein LOC123194574 isoform X1 [Mangifera indica]XP_044463777.1 uncharacterized protein LOC123194574 isoform X1 [Mangifera indica]XP_044463778.1 uncharacterized protein LOC123194574 isoform X1 [Mangifera indica]
MKTLASNHRWRTISRGATYTWLPYPSFTTTSRKRVQGIRMHQKNVKKANLYAARKESIKLPNYDSDCGGNYHIREFLSHPSGIEAMLNTRALQSFESIETHTYRCTLPKVELLNFEVSPVMDLQVIPTDEDCTVRLLSCKFEGSNIVERQNDHFSAFMINHITWYTNDSESFLEADIKLNLSLEIYTQPFTLLPVSAVEGPGNLMMQALLDRLVPVLLQQLLQDYIEWLEQKFEDSP